MNELKLLSIEDRDRSEHELQAFQTEIKQFEYFVSDQLGKFESISNIARQRKEKREVERDLRNQKVRERISSRIKKLEDEMEEKGGEATSMAQQLESVNERLRYFEKRFQQIASATGLTNPDAIINKFALKEEIKSELTNEILEKETLIEQYEERTADLENEYEGCKQAFTESKWKDVDAQQKMSAVSENKQNRSIKAAEKVEQLLATFQEGLQNLNVVIPREVAPSAIEDNEGLMPLAKDLTYDCDIIKQLLSVLEEKLVYLAEEVRIGMQKKKELMDAKLEQQEKERILAFGFGAIQKKDDEDD